MCTVTYLPLANNNFILTSNRDETPLRKTIPPKTYEENGVQLTYPKDELAGGTWIGTGIHRLVCLLNGGFKKHTRNAYYKMSRGIIVKNILSVDEPVAYINEFDFSDIEPFTLVLVIWKHELETYELVWDGTEKHFNKLPQEPKIWSSSTLYTEEMKQLRRDWFSDWLKENEKYQQSSILEFHKNENLGNPEISPKMKRIYIETVSVTSVEKKDAKIEINYMDILADESKVLIKQD
jgi:uncharacterized protein with NRDE domain